MTVEQGTEIVIESCNSRWVFDSSRKRFKRIVKGIDLDPRLTSTGWRPFYGIEIDEFSDSFVVHLDPQGTRLLRSWRHADDGTCPQCGEESTTELRLEELRLGARA